MTVDSEGSADINCGAACFTSAGNIDVIVTVSDGEQFTSGIYEITEFGSVDHLVYEFESWITDICDIGKNIFAIDDDGSLHSYYDDRWICSKLPCDGGLTRIRAATGDRILICGNGGVILQSEDRGGTWNRMDIPEPIDLYDIAYCSSEEILTIGEMGTIYRFRKDRWVKVDSPTNSVLLSLLELSNANKIIACGEKGVLLEIQNNTVLVRESGVNFNLHDLVEYRGTILVAAGGDGIRKLDDYGLIDFKNNLVTYRIT